MNAISAELLQRSMEGLGNTLQRNRQMDIERDLAQRRLDLETQRESTQTARYGAQAAHFERMEDAQGNAAAKQQQMEKDKYDLLVQQGNDRKALASAEQKRKEAKDAFAEFQSSNREFLQHLGQQVKVGALKNETAQSLFQDHLMDMAQSTPGLTDEAKDATVQRMMADPNVRLMTQPGFDFAQLAQVNVMPGANGTQIVTGAKGDVHVVRPPAAPKSGVTQTIKQVANPLGGPALSLTNTTTHLPTAPMPPAQPDPAAILRQPASAQSPTAQTPGQPHIDYLLAHPETAPMFDAKFGQGASMKYLQQAAPQ